MTQHGFIDNEISVNANGGTEIAKRTLTALIDPELLKEFQIISSRPRELDEDKIRILFAHDLATDPEVANLRDVNFRNKFHKLVFISNWQYQQYQLILGVPYSVGSAVIESGIHPIHIDFNEKKAQEEINMVYTSTPQRGLNILIPVFNKLCETHDNIRLHVFSSFKIYGWDDYDKQFEPLYDQCKENPKITYHGFTPHDELQEFLKKCHIFAYPCTWHETSCRAMIEAMSAGLLCVHPNYAGLYDTSGGLNMMYQGDVDGLTHANQFAGALDTAINTIKTNPNINGRLVFNKNFVDARFNINSIKMQWEYMLKDLIRIYPTPEHRKFTKDMFVYKIS